MKIKKKFVRVILKILMWIGISLAGLILLAILFVWIFADRIEQKVVDVVNQNLKAELFVNDIDVTLFYDFPNVSVVFKEITMLDATPEKKGILFSSKHSALEFNLFSVICGNYSIRKISISSGKVDLKIFEDGKNNFDILKPSDSDDGSESANFNLRKIKIDNMGISFQNQVSNQKYCVFIRDFDASGNIDEELFDLDTQTSFRIDTLYVDDTYFIPGLEFEVDGAFNVNTKSEVVDFNSVGISFADIELNSFGKVIYADSSETIDVSIKSEKVEIEEIISILPDKMQEFFKDFKKEGDFSFDCKVAGSYGKNEIGVDLNLLMNNGAIDSKSVGLVIDKICFDASFSSKNLSSISSYQLLLKDFSAQVENKPLRGSFSMVNFKRPKTKIILDGQLSLASIQKIAKISQIRSMKGDARFSLNFDGQINDIDNINVQDFLKSKTSGSVVVENAEIALSSLKNPLKKMSANVEFSNQDLDIKKFVVQYGKSDFQVNGFFKDFVPFMFEKNQKLQLSGKLVSKNFDVLDIIGDDKSDDTDSTSVKLVLPENIVAKLDVDIAKLVYGKFSASNVASEIQMNNKKLSIEDLSCKTLGGRINASGVIDNSKSGIIHVSCEADFKNLDIREALISFNDFGQTSITSENLRGRTNSKIQLSVNFSDALEVDNKSINAVLDLEINNGELVGYAPLNDMKKILKNRDFENITFEKLSNTISIKDELISMPKMEIRSSAMNMKLSGKHSFDNEIEYHVEVKFSDLKKNGEKVDPESEYGYVVDNDLGRTVFMLVSGTVDDPKFTQLDKAAMKEKIKDDIGVEKQNMRQILHDEFGLFKKDTTLNKIEKPKPQDTKFEIDWEEE